ncbi:MAG: hypothetical protein D6741_15200 [Planctomycetota bacterium]|nr:MAG: hypothetical protein D6741_15200 [Planctomycetota bacterium]
MQALSILFQRRTAFLWVVLIPLLVAGPAIAQPPGFGGGYRGPGGPGGYDRGRGGDDRGRGSDDRGRSDDPEERARRFVEFMSRLDQNHDGTLSREEIEGNRMGQYLAGRLKERTGMDPARGIRIKDAEKKLREYYKREAEGGSRSSSGASTPSVPGFGVQREVPDVPGFGSDAKPGYTVGGPLLPPRPTGSGSSSSGAGSAGSGNSQAKPEAKPELDERVKRYAQGLLNRYDKNKNGKLEKDEWSEMRGDPASADRDKDGVITLDELTLRLMNYSRGSSSSSSSSGSSSSSSSSASSSGTSTGNRHYRYTPPTERLPAGLPDWFRSRDENGDGQIMMNEYTGFWDEETAREFTRYDLNNDGVITPQECLAVEGE